jgi:hypothetical protein
MTATTASRGRTARKVLGSLGVIGAAAAVAGMGTFGSFTDSTTPLNASVSSGTLDLNLTGPNNTATAAISATGFVPGDSVNRQIDLRNDGNLDMAAIGMSVKATASSILDTDTVNGLKLTVQSCSALWSATNTCSGTTSVVVAPTAAVGDFTPNYLTSLTAGKSDHLLLTLTLPTTADNSFQNKSSALTVTFTGTQKTGTSR